MAIIDQERDVLILRVVYDGPGMSGKTTTLRTLAAGLGVEITTPAEQDGRTLFFDWVDYVGGLFEGRKIRCQIVSVPGQSQLAERRKLLLESADAVVFVADTRPRSLETSLEILRELMPGLREKDPPVGVVMQANKRDDPTSVGRDELLAKVGAIAPVAVVESVATVGKGVREAFVFGVRLALDRVRALALEGRLSVGKAAVNAPEDLLAQLSDVSAPSTLPQTSTIDSEIFDFDTALSNVQLEGLRSLDLEIDKVLPARQRTPAAVVDGEEVFVPNPMMQGGFIWPPVDGRSLLYEVSQLDLRPERTARGDWWASGFGWRFHSVGDATYCDTEDARNALIAWARLHATHHTLLSEGRTVILADAGETRLRLWQLVRVEESLREQLATMEPTDEPEAIVERVYSAASQLLRARSEISSGKLALPCTLWTIGVDNRHQSVYVGLMPSLHQELDSEPDGVVLVEREFAPVLRDLKRECPEYHQIISAFQRKLDRWSSNLVLETLTQMARS